jgi:hypothetical protein
MSSRLEAHGIQTLNWTEHLHNTFQYTGNLIQTWFPKGIQQYG